jgi:hypothetical protein
LVTAEATVRVYRVCEALWTGPQRHSEEPSRVFHVNYTDEHVKKMKEAGVWQTFAPIQMLMTNPQAGGHPINKTGIGWVRYTQGADGGIHLEEAQSDICQARLAGQLQAGGYDTHHGHLDKIREIFTNGRKTGQDLLAETFLHHQRQDPTNHGKALHWPTMDIKSQQADPPADTYNRLPKDLGFSEGGQYGQLNTQSNSEFKGLPTYTSKVTKTEEELVESMAQFLLKHFKDQ